MNKLHLEYIEFTELSEEAVCASLHLFGVPYFSVNLPLLDDCRSHES